MSLIETEEIEFNKTELNTPYSYIRQVHPSKDFQT